MLQEAKAVLKKDWIKLDKIGQNDIEVRHKRF